MGMMPLFYHNLYLENATLLFLIVVLCSLYFRIIKLVGYFLTVYGQTHFSVSRNIANALTVHMRCIVIFVNDIIFIVFIFWNLHLYFIIRSYNGISCLHSCAVTQIASWLHTAMYLARQSVSTDVLLSQFLPFCFFHSGCCSS